jgi:hypothetical protein
LCSVGSLCVCSCSVGRHVYVCVCVRVLCSVVCMFVFCGWLCVCSCSVSPLRVVSYWVGPLLMWVRVVRGLIFFYIKICILTLQEWSRFFLLICIFGDRHYALYWIKQAVLFSVQFHCFFCKMSYFIFNQTGCCCSRFSFIVSSVRCHTLISSNIYFMSVYLYVNINCVFLVKYSEVIDIR